MSRDPSSAKCRKRYSTPRLVRFGKVSMLTRTGTRNAVEGGMGTMTPAFMSTSSRQVKENLVRIGEHPWGFGLYLFDYRDAFRDRFGHGRRFGVIAEEVASQCPDAVRDGPHGFPTVDYQRLGIFPHET